MRVFLGLRTWRGLAGVLVAAALGGGVACGGSSMTSVSADASSPNATDASVPDATLSGAVCVPGQQIACGCPGGGSGAQVCASDGRSYGSCTGCGGEEDGSIDATDAAIACPTGLQCNVSCDGGGTTTLTGKVYDPAGKNPIFNAFVYVPASPLAPLPRGVLTGADACSCGALFKSGAVVSARTGADGSFTLSNVPVGSTVPLVLQIGKWRRLLHVAVDACEANAQLDKSLTLPGTVPAGDTDDNVPDIAVSTGSADTLECLLSRVGIPTTEYVAGAGSTGHVHIFTGGARTAQVHT